MTVFVIQTFNSCMDYCILVSVPKEELGGVEEDHRKLQSKAVKTRVFEKEEENAVFLTIITHVLLYKGKLNLYNEKVKFCSYDTSAV